MSPTIHHIIPENEQYCVWMDAGVVDYKLCNCQFTCDSCAFDVQIRTENRFSKNTDRIAAAIDASAIWLNGGDGPAKAAQADADKPSRTEHMDMPSYGGASHSAHEQWSITLKNVLRTVNCQALPDDRFYSSNHTWAMEEKDGSGMVVLGIDHFIGTMLGAGHSVAFPVPPTLVRANEPYAWIVANGETLAVRSPISGTIVENNPALADRALAIHSDPYRQGWIARIRPDDDTRTSSLETAQQFARTIQKDGERFEQTISSKFFELPRVIGSTMYDGGTVLNNFEDMLGTKMYYEILEQFLRSSM
jgi:glycine cleavage system H protein